jgi:hypothetical protein
MERREVLRLESGACPGILGFAFLMKRTRGSQHLSDGGRRKMRSVWFLVMLPAAVLVSGQNAHTATIWVSPNARGLAPGISCNNAGYATIQAAINAANAGDTVNVCPGSYIENITVNKANLTVSSTGGAVVTIIKAAVISSVVTLTGVNATVAGFTLVPAGSVAKYDIGVNVAIAGNAGAQIAHNYIRGGRIGVNLGCASSGSTVYHNNVSGATETGINIDTCEIAPAYPGSTFNSVHHNTVCGGLFPYSIAGGQGSDFNSIHHNTARWITLSGDGNIVHNNTAQLVNIVPGNPANITFNNTAAAVCR